MSLQSLPVFGFIPSYYFEIMIPIGTGFIINLILYIIFKNILKTKHKALKFTWYAALIGFFTSITIISLIFGGWNAVGPLVISLGMILAAIVLSLYEKVFLRFIS